MVIDFDKISKISGLTIAEAEMRYNGWRERKKNSIVDHKLIALMSNVSPATVSNYFNGKNGAVSKKKGLIIQTIIDYLGYIPDSAAKRLRSDKKMCIAYIAPISNSCSSEYYLDILKGLKKEAARKSYFIDVYDIDENQDKNFLDTFPFLGLVDGIVLASSKITSSELIPVNKRNIPVYLINPKEEERKKPFVGSVCSDTNDFVFLLDHLFKERKFQNPVLVSVPTNGFSQRIEKHFLFKKKMLDYGINFNEHQNIFLVESYALEEGRNVFSRIMENNSNVDAIITLSDIIAVPILREIEKKGKNIAITGYGNFTIAPIFDLTTIDQKIQELGKKAAFNLLKAIEYIDMNNEFPPYKKEILKGSFVQRLSSGK